MASKGGANIWLGCGYESGRGVGQLSVWPFCDITEGRVSDFSHAQKISVKNIVACCGAFKVDSAVERQEVNSPSVFCGFVSNASHCHVDCQRRRPGDDIPI